MRLDVSPLAAYSGRFQRHHRNPRACGSDQYEVDKETGALFVDRLSARRCTIRATTVTFRSHLPTMEIRSMCW